MSPTIAKSLPEPGPISISSETNFAALGRTVHELETPALLIDLDVMEANMRAMCSVLDGTGVSLRPHFKNHRSIALARRQVAAGATGLCVARLRHAEALADAGISHLLLTNEVVREAEFARVAALSARADLIVAVDSEPAIAGLAHAAERAGTEIQVAVDVDLGLRRTGVAPEAVPRLAALTSRGGLRLRGLTAYEGHLQRLPPGPEKQQLCREAVRTMAGLAEVLRAAGHTIDLLSAGGTGTCSYAVEWPGLTEIQAGCYLLMETQYEQSAPRFLPALALLATVISRQGNRAVVDAGLKALSAERGLGSLVAGSAVRVSALHAEHGFLSAEDGRELPELGRVVELSVPYADGTVNLHRQMIGVRNGVVEAIFAVQP